MILLSAKIIKPRTKSQNSQFCYYFILEDLITFLIPQISCPVPVHLGNIGDDGKWLCQPWRVNQIEVSNLLSWIASNFTFLGKKRNFPVFFQNHSCIAYSLGVNSDVSAELDLYSITNQHCRIYSFHLGNQSLDLFRPCRIAKETDLTQNTYTVVEIIEVFGHENIDFLKIGIEG